MPRSNDVVAYFAPGLDLDDVPEMPAGTDFIMEWPGTITIDDVTSTAAEPFPPSSSSLVPPRWGILRLGREREGRRFKGRCLYEGVILVIDPPACFWGCASPVGDSLIEFVFEWPLVFYSPDGAAPARS